MKSTTKNKEFKGEIEKYLSTEKSNFESKIRNVFYGLKMKTILCQTNIKKSDGYSSFHLLFMFFTLSLLKIETVNTFIEKRWYHWSKSGKDAFYRFKNNSKYKWRSFLYKVNQSIFKKTEIAKVPQEERYFVIDDTIIKKLGRKIENVSFIFDHNLGKSVLGFCILTLGLFTPTGFYALDFAYRFGEKRHPKSKAEKIGNKKSQSGQRSYEAKTLNKLELALMMIERAINAGIIPGYVLFDSWFSNPTFIKSIRALNETIHVICRLKNNNVLYEYKGKKYNLSELYQKAKKNFKKDQKTGLLLSRLSVKFPDSSQEVVIVFSKGYIEPKIENIEGVNKKKEPKWAAFLSTNTALHSSTIIQKYTKRWPIEVCFKECKQLFGLGKDQSNNFNAQVFATTMSFMRHNILNYLNTIENYTTMGGLFKHLVDSTALTTYSTRLGDFFNNLFRTCLAKIFNLFHINEDFQPYINSLDKLVNDFAPFQGCET